MDADAHAVDRDGGGGSCCGCGDTFGFAGGVWRAGECAAGEPGGLRVAQPVDDRSGGDFDLGWVDEWRAD